MADCVYTLAHTHTRTHARTHTHTHTHTHVVDTNYIYLQKNSPPTANKMFWSLHKIPSHSEITLNLQMQFYLFSLAISQVWFDFSHYSEIIKHEMFIRMVIKQILKGEAHLQNVKQELTLLLGTFNSTHTMFSPCCAHLLRIYQQASVEGMNLWERERQRERDTQRMCKRVFAWERDH